MKTKSKGRRLDLEKFWIIGMIFVVIILLFNYGLYLYRDYKDEHTFNPKDEVCDIRDCMNLGYESKYHPCIDLPSEDSPCDVGSCDICLKWHKGNQCELGNESWTWDKEEVKVIYKHIKDYPYIKLKTPCIDTPTILITGKEKPEEETEPKCNIKICREKTFCEKCKEEC